MSYLLSSFAGASEYLGSGGIGIGKLIRRDFSKFLSHFLRPTVAGADRTPIALCSATGNDDGCGGSGAAATSGVFSLRAGVGTIVLDSSMPQSIRNMAPSVGKIIRPDAAALTMALRAVTCSSVMLPSSWMPCNANAIGCLLDEFGSLHHTIGMAVEDIV